MKTGRKSSKHPVSSAQPSSGTSLISPLRLVLQHTKGESEWRTPTGYEAVTCARHRHILARKLSISSTNRGAAPGATSSCAYATSPPSCVSAGQPWRRTSAPRRSSPAPAASRWTYRLLGKLTRGPETALWEARGLTSPKLTSGPHRRLTPTEARFLLKANSFRAGAVIREQSDLA